MSTHQPVPVGREQREAQVDPPSPDRPTHTVRPRWAWSGMVLVLLALGLLGLGVIGVGAGERSVGLPAWQWLVAGGLLLALGVPAALYGNLFYDTEASLAPARVAEDVVHGTTREAPDPTARVDAPVARARAVEDSERTRELLSARTSWTRPPAAPIGIALLLATSVWLVLAEYDLYPDDIAGKDGALRDGGIAVLIAVSALVMRLDRPTPRAWLVALGCALALVLSSLLVDSGGILRGNELVTGVLVAVGCLISSAKTHSAGTLWAARRGAQPR